jgi:DNA-binding MarR family transcriptional regulator
MDDTNRDLLEQIYHLAWFLRRFQMQHLRERGPMGSPYQGQGRILALLKLKPQISQKDLAQILDIRSQSLGELLAKLERQGYITRTPSPADRRVMDISLTEAGRAVAEQENGSGEMGSFFDCLTPEEKTNLGGYLARLLQELEQQLGAGEGPSGFGGRQDLRDPRTRGPFRRDDREPPFGFGGFGRRIDRDDPRLRGRRPGPAPTDPRG